VKCFLSLILGALPCDKKFFCLLARVGVVEAWCCALHHRTPSRCPQEIVELFIPSPEMGDDPMACRVFAQTWDPNLDLEALGDAVVDLAHTADALTIDEYASRVENLQFRIASVSLADRAAAASAEVALLDREELNTMVADFARLSAEARRDIASLRIQLVEERRASERRVQYNALAKVIRKEQPREVSEDIVATARAAITQLEARTRDIEKKKTAAKMEFQLLLQCVADLEVYAFTDAISPSEVRDHMVTDNQRANQSTCPTSGGNNVDVDMTDA
jgi:hypothetical protein